MKVNKLEEQRTTCIEKLLVGQTFTTSRTGNVKNGSRLLMGYYMKVDKSSGISIGLRQSEDLAVNLELRPDSFASLIKVSELQRYR